MSVLSIGDMISSNLLSELDLNPAWEKWRGYFLAGSIVCSLIPFYMTLNGLELHCVPKQTGGHFDFLSETNVTNISPYPILCCGNISNPSSVNSDCEKVVPRKLYRKTLSQCHNSLRNATMESGETNYINARCATQDDLFMLRYSGAIMLGMVLVIIFVSTFWLHVENVKDGIQRFADAIQCLPKVHLSRSEMKRLCSETSVESNDAAVEPMKTDRNEMRSRHVKAVRGCITMLTSDESTQKIFTWYRKRCIVLICVILSFVGSFAYATVEYGHWQNELNCRPTLNKRVYVSLYEEFHCTVNSAYAILGFIITFGVTLLLQALMFLLPYLKWRSAVESEYYNSSVRLLVMFWNSSIPANSGLFRDIADYINTDEYKLELTENMPNICERQDYELIRVKANLSEDVPEVLHEVYHVFAKSPTYPNLSMFIEVMKDGRFLPLTNESKTVVKNLIDKITEAKRISNELLVNLLQSGGAEKIDDIVEIIDLNIIENIAIDSEERRSILFYAFSKKHSGGPNRFTVAKALCQRISISKLMIGILKTPVQTIAEPQIPCVVPLEAYLLEIYETKKEVESIINECTLENNYVIRKPRSTETGRYGETSFQPNG